MNIVFLGSPGAGKGTQAIKLSDDKGFTHISTGDIFRAELKNNTELGKLAKQFIDNGELVPDDVVVDMVDAKIKSLGDIKGCILDGFPRTLNQGKAMEGKIDVALVIYIHVDKQEIIDRLSIRRVCGKCGNIQPNSENGLCNTCGGTLAQRDDDKPEVILNRLTVYETQTMPLIDYYKDKFYQIDGAREIDEVYKDILSVLEKFNAGN